jgi:hypothetical protein
MVDSQTGNINGSRAHLTGRYQIINETNALAAN